MKDILKIFKPLWVLLIFCLCSSSLYAKDNPMLHYEIEGAGTGAQGTYLIKIHVFSKNKKVSEDEVAKCAVHGVLFRGFSSKEFRQRQKPIAGSALVEQQHEDFFTEFFKTAYLNYVQAVQGSRVVTKVGKQYRVSVVMSVAKDQLKKDLEAAGIIKGLNNGF
ncbi:MAG: hypothetical protein IJ816_01600 [Alloprevotella sp.]|nr:hypothetical protein [Alloprevotella sp.]